MTSFIYPITRIVSQMCKPLIVMFALLHSMNIYALPEDRNQPIQLEADQAYLNNQTGKAEYTGNVIIIQGTAKLTADKVIIHSQNNEITRMEAFGELAHYQQIINQGEEATHIEGNKLDIELAKDLATVTGNGKVSRGKDVFTGKIIRYGLKSGELKVSGSDVQDANSNESSPGRVKLIFHPQNTSSNEANNPSNTPEKSNDK